jgi:predicted nucleic acid-binding protein
LKANPHFVLIDTSAWIEFFRRRGDVAIRDRVISLVRTGQAAWCEIIRLELWNGASGQKELNELEQMEFSATLLPITSEIWNLVDQMARSTRLAAKTFPVSDLLIAACARHYNVDLIHKDQHFDQLKAL